MSASRKRPGRSAAVICWAGSALAAAATAVRAEEAAPATPAEAAATAPQSEAPAAAEPPRKGIRELFIDDDDRRFDFSDFLSRGGFVPLPIIITEPAVGGGGGFAAAFLKPSPERPRQVTRTAVAAFKTGNGSEGIGFVRAGYLFDGRLNYRVGAAKGKITLEAFPAAAPGGVEYTSHYDYGIVGSALWSLGGHLSAGPLFDFRKLRSTLDIQGLPPEFSDQFGSTLKTGAVGLGLHYDSRDNPLTPTRGLNTYAEGKFNRELFGSDRDYEEYDAGAYVFGGLTPRLNWGLKLELNAIRGDFPVYFAPAINLRGLQALRYQGMNAVSSEAEATWRASRRWALVAFGGVGASDAGHTRLFEDSGAIFTGGAGVRYRLARKLGLDAGVDVAYGPQGAVFYIQFGHAWGVRMD